MKIKICFIIFCLLEIVVETKAQKINFSDSLLFYFKKNDFDKAIFFSEKILNDNKINHEQSDTSVADMLSDLGYLYKQKGVYEKADSVYKQCMELRKNIFGTYSVEYANILNMFSGLYIATGQYAAAKDATLKSVKIYEEKTGPESNEYANGLNTLANIYVRYGDFSEAELLQNQSLKIRRKIKGDKDNLVGISESNITVLYSELGNYAEAETRCKRAIDIFENNNYTNNYYYANAISNLGYVYNAIGRYELADSVYRKALNLKEKIFGKKHNEYALAVNELASLYQKVGKIDDAEKLFLEAVEVRKIAVGENHPDYAISLRNLAGLYFAKSDLSQSENLFLKSLSVIENNFGREGIEYVNTSNNLANLYNVSGSYEKAKTRFILTSGSAKNLLLNQLDFLSERELVSYLKSQELSFSYPFTTLWNYHSSQLISTAYNSHLFLKGIALENAQSLTSQMEQSKDSLLAGNWKYYKSNKLLLNKILSQPIAKRTLNTDSLTNLTNQQEKELLRRSAGYRNMKEKLNITWQDVKSHLKTGEAAIEFVRFNYLKRTIREADTIYYAAMLLRPQDTVPVFVKLFEEQALKAAFKSFPYTAQQAGNAISSTKKTSIYTILWQPLEPYLTATNTIYFSPDGLLHQVAFAAIPYKTGLLCDQYKLVQLTSTRQLIISAEKETAPEYVALFGGINYNRQNTDTTITAAPDAYRYVYQQSRSAGLDSFKYLPGTLKEIQGIKQGMELRRKQLSVYTGDKATEAAFRNMAASGLSPQVIHFATHGFTLPDEAKNTGSTNTFKVSDNPLLRSGLVMAGGNRGWKNQSSPDEDDGILTALEISAVPLQHTQLAVLSACQSGTGKLMGSEGVFGLQRAFKLAGANYVMASLWPVPDKETAEFMNSFYATWLSGKTIRQAFANTQQTMRKKYTPYYWAAFTLVQ